jgi:hypothetical protein
MNSKNVIVTDKRLITQEVAKLAQETRHLHDIYFAGLMDGRADPGVRGVFIRYDEKQKGPKYRVLSYDELVTTATMISVGFPKRVAAAHAAQGLAVSVPHETPLRADGRRTYAGVTVALQDGTKWDVAFPMDTKPEDLIFREDYAVWLEVNGAKTCPDEARETGDNPLCLIRAENGLINFVERFEPIAEPVPFTSVTNGTVH